MRKGRKRPLSRTLCQTNFAIQYTKFVAVYGYILWLILVNIMVIMVNIDCNNGLQLFFVGLLNLDALHCLFEKYSLVCFSEYLPTHGAWEKVQANIERRGREEHARGAQGTEPGAQGRPDQDGGRVSVPEAQSEKGQGSPAAINSIGNFKQYIQILPGLPAQRNCACPRT